MREQKPKLLGENKSQRQKMPSMAPKEHGAYGQIALPLLCVLCARAPSAASLLLGVAALCVFFAHEPLLVLIGHRGSKAAREWGKAALKRLLLLGALASGAGGFGLWLAPNSARLGALIPTLGIFLLIPLIRAKQEKSLLGESLAAAALSFTAFPVALASSLPVRDALGICITFTLSFAAATWAVRSVIQHSKSPTSTPSRVWPIFIYGALLCLFPALNLLAWSSVLCALPMLLFSLALALRPPAPTSLRKVGFSLVFASLLNTLFFIASIRIPFQTP